MIKKSFSNRIIGSLSADIFSLPMLEELNCPESFHDLLITSLVCKNFCLGFIKKPEIIFVCRELQFGFSWIVFPSGFAL